MDLSFFLCSAAEKKNLYEYQTYRHRFILLILIFKGIQILQTKAICNSDTTNYNRPHNTIQQITVDETIQEKQSLQQI